MHGTVRNVFGVFCVTVTRCGTKIENLTRCGTTLLRYTSYQYTPQQQASYMVYYRPVLLYVGVVVACTSYYLVYSSSQQQYTS